MSGVCWSCEAPADDEAVACAGCGSLLRVRGKYRITRRLGIGGMGEVYEARDLALDRRVAVKLLFGNAAARPEKRARFLTECRAMAALDHPHVVRIHEADVDNDRLVLVQSFVDGTPLADHLTPPWTEERLRPFVAGVLDALVHAHAKGIAHRDVNPNNVLVLREGGGPMLIDFGMARLRDQGATRAAWGGTPGFAAPEQILAPESNDPRSDLYAVGAMTFAMLTGGAKPYAGALAGVAGNPHALLEGYRRIATGEVPVDDGGALARAAPGDELHAWLARMLAPAPEARFATAADARDALGGGEPSRTAAVVEEAPPASPTPNATRTPPARAPWPRLAFAAAAAVVVVGLGSAWIQRARAPELDAPPAPSSAPRPEPASSASTSGSTSASTSTPPSAPFTPRALIRPAGLALASDGSLLVADQAAHWIARLVDGRAAETLGSGRQGYLDGPVAEAAFDKPTAVLPLGDGALLVADTGNHRIRRIEGGRVTTVTGDFDAGRVDGDLVRARFAGPQGLMLHTDGSVWVADTGNHAVRRIAEGRVETIGGGRGAGREDGPLTLARFHTPNSLVQHPDGRILVWDGGTSSLRSIEGNRVRTVATLPPGATTASAEAASEARYPHHAQLAVRQDGTVWIADPPSHRLWRLEGDRLVVVAGTGEGRSRDGEAITAALLGPSGLVHDGGALVFAEAWTGRVRRLAGEQVTTTLDAPLGGYGDGPAARALFAQPWGLAVAPDGAVVVADTRNRRVRRVHQGHVTTVAGSGGVGTFLGPAQDSALDTPAALAVRPDGSILLIDTVTDRVLVIGDRVVSALPAVGARWVHPEGVAIHPDGRVLIADTGGHRVWSVGAHGEVAILAGTGKPGRKDGAAAEAELNAPVGLAVGPDGSIYVAEVRNHDIRRIHEGRVHTFAGLGRAGHRDGDLVDAQFEAPLGLAMDPGGTLWVADSGNHAIRAIRDGRVRTAAGRAQPGFRDGAAAEAAFVMPTGVAWDGGGLVIADSGNHLIRRLVGGEVHTLAGTSPAPAR